jgi:hypothetical protein
MYLITVLNDVSEGKNRLYVILGSYSYTCKISKNIICSQKHSNIQDFISLGSNHGDCFLRLC